MSKYRIIICLFALAVLSGQACATSYTAIDLGNFSGWAINDLGQIGGYVNTGIAPFRAAVRGDDGTISNVPLWSEDSDSSVLGISNIGYVVGMCHSGAFRWNGIAAPQQLEGPGLKDVPNAVNNKGIVAGWSADANLNSRAVIWNQNGEMEIIPGLSGESEAYDINDAGLVIGRDSTGYFLWNGSIPVEYLGFHTAAVNNDGWIVGNNLYGAVVLREPGGNIHTLGTPSGWDNWNAVDINDLGQILGLARNDSVDGYHVVIRDSDGSVLNLGAGQPFALNNRGQAVGMWNDTTDGSVHSILWTPVPEPSTLSFLSLSLAGIGVGRLRRRR